MTDLAKLRTEIVGDPLARGYAGMTDGQLAADLHTVDRTIERETLPSWEVMDAIVPAERAGLANTGVVSAADRALFDNWIGAGDPDQYSARQYKIVLRLDLHHCRLPAQPRQFAGVANAPGEPRRGTGYRLRAPGRRSICEDAVDDNRHQ